MLRRLLPSAARSLVLFPTARRFSAASQLQRASEPLRILFCGSDEFSIASLRALDKARRDEASSLIASIDVVHRPAKPTGRGLKTLKEVPIKQTATQLNLPTHPLDTFTNWTPPSNFNLIIAVSFGLFIPPRILSASKHGGINVHPSLLPDLRGPAPIEHALLQRRTHTGISIQTLHPKHFDRGTILLQTPPPGIPIPKSTDANTLTSLLALHGAEMLLEVLERGLYLPPYEDKGWYKDTSNPRAHAPKITKEDSKIDFSAHSLDDILARQAALGRTWCVLPNARRLIIHEMGVHASSSSHPSCPSSLSSSSSPPPGLFTSSTSPHPLFHTPCGHTVEIKSSTYEGGKTGQGNVVLRRLLADNNKAAAAGKGSQK